jgi:methyl-accepting chemotaxis protein
MRFTIGTKLAAIGGVALVGVLVLMLFDQHQTTRVFESANYANANTVPSFEDLTTAQTAIEGNRRRIWEHIAVSDSGVQAALEREMGESDAKADRSLDQYEKNDLSDDTDRRLLETDRSVVADYRAMRDKALALSRAGKKGEARDMVLANQALAAKLSTTFAHHFEYNVELGKKSASEAVALRSSAATTSWIIGLVALGLIGVVAFVIGRAVLRSLITCARVAENVANGELSVQIPEGGEDEAGDLLRSLKHMVDNLRALLAARKEMSRQHDLGMIDEVMPVAQFQGAYADMAEGINTLVMSHINVKMRVVEVVGRYAKGDLSVDMDRLPGKKALITQSIDQVKSNLLNLNQEIMKLVTAAKAGNLAARADGSRFEFSFKEMVEGINATLDAVIGPLNMAADCVERISKGDIPPKITETYAGDFNTIKDHLNQCIEAVNGLVRDANMLSSAAVQGQFTTRADVTGHQGDFRKVVQGVNGTLDVVVDKLEWYRSILDAVPFPIHVIDNNMNWVFLNKAFEKLMVDQGYVKDRQDAVGRPCSTANANICRTKGCGIEQLRIGVGQSFFDWCGMNCKQDTAYVLNAKGERVGFVETVTDLTSTLRVKNYTEHQVDVVAKNLEQLSQGDLNLDYTLLPADTYTKDVAKQFTKINESFMAVGKALTALSGDTSMLTSSAQKGEFSTRAEAAKHEGDFRKIVQGVNATLDVVVDKLEWYRSIIDAVPFPIHVIDNNMTWVFLNKAFEKLMVDQGYVKDRQDAVGRPCSTANANICRTKGCGIEQLRIGVGQSLFDWCGMNCKQDTAYVLNGKGERVGFVETVTDLTSTLRVKHYTERQVDVVARNLEQLSRGDLNLDYTLSASDTYTKDVAKQFAKINDSFMGVGKALTALSSDAAMLSSATLKGELSVRADATKHEGDFRKIMQGVNDTLDAVIGPLNMAAGYVDRISRGDIPPKITETYNGDFNTIKNNLNQCIDGLQGLVESNQVLQQLATNDFTVRVKGQYLGIFADVAQALNTTIENQAQALTKVQESAYVVAQSSGEIATGNQELSSRTEQQASNLEETASSLEEFTSMVNQTAENARSASGAAAQARTVADEGSKAVEQLVGSMDAINAASSRINEIISVVDEIAFQTNLLALNAAVEAARAGEQGRGFAVVATEVRNLAKRSADAAKEIKSLIKDSVTKAQDGQKVATRTGQIILDVVTNVQKVSEIMADIANATHEQTMGIGEINKAVTQMDETTQHNAALVEEAAASAENLDHQAQNLRQIVARYRLNANAQEPMASVPAALPAPTRRPVLATKAGRSPERPGSTLAPRKRDAKGGAAGKAGVQVPKGDEDEWESF